VGAITGGLDHRLLVALQRAAATPLAVTVYGESGVVEAGFATPAEVRQRLRPGERAVGAALQPVVGESGPSWKASPCRRTAGEAALVVVDHRPDVGHPALRGRVASVHDLHSGERWTAGAGVGAVGPSHHGTSVVGTAVAASGGTVDVICPSTWREAAGWELHPGQVAWALEREAARAEPPAVVLLALERHGDLPVDPIGRAVRACLDAGVLVVAAAGNHPGRHSSWTVRDGGFRWTPSGEGTLCVWLRAGVAVVDGERVALDAGPAGLRRIGGAWVSLLHPEAPVLSVTSSSAVTVDVQGDARVFPPFPNTGELRFRGHHAGRGSVGRPGTLPGVICVGAEGVGAVGVDDHGAALPHVVGPARLRAPANGGGLRAFQGTSAAAAHAAGLLARLVAEGCPDPRVELSRMLRT